MEANEGAMEVGREGEAINHVTPVSQSQLVLAGNMSDNVGYLL